MREKKGWLKDLAFYVGWFTEFAGSIGGGTIIGYFLDGKFKSFPWLTLLGFLAGAFYSYRSFWLRIKGR